MFQDLVESDVLYCALFENDKTLTFRPQWLAALGPDRFETLCPEHPELAGLAHVYNTAASGLTLWHDARSNETFIGLPPKTS
jgi:pyruvate,water dikinase